MPLKARVRRALGRPSSSSSPADSTRASSTSSSTSTSQTNLSTTLSSSPSDSNTSPDSSMPAITLTKTSTSSTSRLSKITSWRKDKPWKEPKMKPIPAKYAKHQELLGAFEMKFGRNGGDGDERSVWSGVSPMASRCCSVDLRRGDDEVEAVGNAVEV